MADTPKHILIVNFDFPHNQGIGGRRWAKFAKELARRNYVVHVIKADAVPGNIPSPWTEDVRDQNIRIYSLPRKYPLSFSHPDGSLLGKIKYRLARRKLYLSEKGTIYDAAIGWEKEFSAKAGALIKEYGIVNVIASGAPWYVLVYTARLKQQFPQLYFIADFRDPWLNAKNYGMANLSADRMETEVKKFTLVLDQADVVIAPNRDMVQEIQKRAKPESKSKFQVISHFFDPEDIPEVKQTHAGEEIHIVYGGDLYIGLQPQFEILVDQLNRLKADFPEVYRRVKFKMYTNSSAPDILRNNEKIEIKPSIGKGLFDALNEADYCLIMLTDAKRNEPTTKFMEFLPMRKPLLVLAPQGEITQLVTSEKLGYVVEANDPTSLGQILTSTGDFNRHFDLQKFRLDSVTDQLCKLLA